MVNRSSDIVNGISFGSVCNSDEQLLDLIRGDYECLEIHVLDYERMDHIIGRCRKNKIEYALHYPSLYSVCNVEFDVMDSEKREKVLTDLENYVKRYSDAAYYVIHFPNIRLKDLSIDHYADSLSKIYARFQDQKDKLIIENLSYLTAKEYKEICDCVGAGLCLDVGHSHLLGSKDLEIFFSELKEYIKVIHYYNTSRDYNDIYYGKHVPFSFTVLDGINKEKLDKLIHGLRNKIYVIDETDSKYYFKWGMTDEKYREDILKRIYFTKN